MTFYKYKRFDAVIINFEKYNPFCFVLLLCFFISKAVPEFYLLLSLLDLDFIFNTKGDKLKNLYFFLISSRAVIYIFINNFLVSCGLTALSVIAYKINNKHDIISFINNKIQEVNLMVSEYIGITDLKMNYITKL